MIGDSRGAALILQPRKWPLHPFLPLTHRRERDDVFPRLGVLMDGDAIAMSRTGLTVFLVNIGEIRLSKLAEVEQFHYGSVSDLLNDWQVD